jgi:hypothetical protein
MKSFSKVVMISGVMIVVLGAMTTAHAGTIFTIADGNSSADIDTASQAGMSNWTVNGTDHLSQQWFWYRVGDTEPEASIDTLAVLLQGTSDTNLDTVHDTLYVKYGGRGFELEVRYALDGGAAGSLTSDIAENITITNTGDSSLDFHFFQYSDFDLGGTVPDEGAEKTNANAIRQWDSILALNETVVTPPPDHWEVGLFASTLNSLNDTGPTTLSDVSVIGPGDLTWALQWDFSIDPGQDFQISKDKQLRVVPEPVTMVLLGTGFLGLVARKRRARKA